MCSLDVVQRANSLQIRLHMWVRSQVDAHIRSPGQNNVQIAVRYSEGVAHHELLVGDDAALEISQLLCGITSDEGLDVFSQRGVEETTDGRMNLSGDIAQHILQNSASNSAIGRCNCTWCSLT